MVAVDRFIDRVTPLGYHVLLEAVPRPGAIVPAPNLKYTPDYADLVVRKVGKGDKIAGHRREVEGMKPGDVVETAAGMPIPLHTEHNPPFAVVGADFIVAVIAPALAKPTTLELV